MIGLSKNCGFLSQLYLQVIRQFRATSVSRVHCDEDSTGRVQPQLCTLKHQHLSMIRDSYMGTWVFFFF